MEKVLRSQATATVLAVEGHSVAVTSSGRVFSWGFNNNGQGGHCDFSAFIKFPKLIRTRPKRIWCSAAVGSCGYVCQDQDRRGNFDEHSLLVTDNGKLYSFGYGLFGQLGHCTTHDHWVPTHVQSFAGELIASAAAGQSHTLAVTRSGRVYA